jgi:hypothetical protein
MAGGGILHAREMVGDPNFRVDVGSVLARTLSVWGRNLVPFCLVGLVIYSPVLLGLGAIAASGGSMPIGQKILDVLSNLLTMVLTGGVTYGVFSELRGQRPDVADVLRLGLSRLGTVWLTGLLAGLGMGLGFCALIIPGLVLLARWWVAVPVAVIEAPGASAAISRSTELTEGNRWRIFALAVVVGMLQFGAAVAIAVAISALPGAKSAAANELTAWAEALQELVLIPVLALAAVAPAIAYHDLRIGKEGADIEELLSVFE